MRPFDKRLLRYARATRGFIYAAIVTGLLTAGLLIVQAFALTDIVVPVFTEGADLSGVSGAIAVLGVAIAFRVALAYVSETLAFRSSAKAKSELRDACLRHLVDLGPVWLSGRNSASLTTLLTRGIDGLDAYFSRYLPQLVLAVVVPITVGVVIAVEDPLAAVIVLVTVPLIPLFMILVGLYTQKKVQRQWLALALLSGHFADVVAGMPTLKIFGRAKAQAAKVTEVGDEYRSTTMAVLRISFLSSLVLELLAMLSVAVVAVSIGLRLVGGSMTLQAGLLVLILIPEVYLPLRQVGLHYHAAAEGLGAAKELIDILEEPPVDSGASLVETSAPSIVLDAVSASYSGSREPALIDFSAQFEPGKITALTGPSGCGKSTVLNILERFMNYDSGTVSVDGIELDQVDTGNWRSKVTWIGQQPHLIPGSIADNLRLANSAADDGQLRSALEAVALDEFVAQLPDGIHTQVGEAGLALSDGQARRLALARAFVRDCGVVLLDEPTAALDERTEDTVLCAVARLAVRNTVVMVAHRRAAIEIADVVIPVGDDVLVGDVR